MVRRQNRSQNGSCRKKRACLSPCAASCMLSASGNPLRLLIDVNAYRFTARLACSLAREATPSDRGLSTTTEKSMPISSGPSSSRKSGNLLARPGPLFLACRFLSFFLYPHVYDSWLSVLWRFKALQFLLSSFLRRPLKKATKSGGHRDPTHGADSYSYRLQYNTRGSNRTIRAGRASPLQAVPNSATERRKAVPQRKMRQ